MSDRRQAGEAEIREGLEDALSQLGRGGAGHPGGSAWPLPDPCDVTPLGVDDAGRYWFSTVRGNLVCKPGAGLTAGVVSNELFVGEIGFLRDQWKARSTREVWDNVSCAAALVQACALMGSFDPRNVRGPGIWWEGDAEWTEAGPGPVVLHCGDQIGRAAWKKGKLAKIKWQRAGCRIGRYVYKGGLAPLPRPADDPATDAEVESLAEFLGTWNLADGSAAVDLLMGLSGLSYVPGLPRHRPYGVLVGNTTVGKSTMFRLFQALHGGHHGAAWRKERMTAALCRDHFRNTRSAGLILFNEFEYDKPEARAMIPVLRDHYTRGEGGWGRGGPDGVDEDGADFSAIVGGINPPPFDDQDANRQVVIAMLPLVDTADAAEVDRCMVRAMALGPKLLRRLLEFLPLWPVAYAAYAGALKASRKGDPALDRAINTYGTVLAFNDVLRFGAVRQERLESWGKRLAWTASTSDERRSLGQRALDRLLSHRVNQWVGGDQHTVAEFLLENLNTHDFEGPLSAVRRLGITWTDVGPGRDMAEGRWLAISTTFSGVSDLFAKVEALDEGRWQRALLSLEGARRTDAVRFGRHDFGAGASKELRTRAILIPVEHLGFADADKDERERAARAAMGWTPTPLKPASDDPDFALGDDE